MATTWELVQEHSTAPVGSSFWEHLNAQEGGGGGGVPYPVYYKDITVSADVQEMSVLVDSTEVTIDAADSTINVDNPETTIEVPTITVEID